MLLLHQILIIHIDKLVSAPQSSVYNAPITVYETRKVLGLSAKFYGNFSQLFRLFYSHPLLRKFMLIEVCISKGAMTFFSLEKKQLQTNTTQRKFILILIYLKKRNLKAL